MDCLRMSLVRKRKLVGYFERNLNYSEMEGSLRKKINN